MLLTDKMIRELCTPPVDSKEWIEATGWRPMLDPFSEGVSGNGIISYGLSHAGYDLRLAPEVLVFKNSYGEIVDPKKFKDPEYQNKVFDRITAGEDNSIIIPAYGYVLGRSVEYITMPRDLKGRCVGKSTYARCFTGDTRVALVDGTAPTFEELVDRFQDGEREFYGYGYINGNYVVQGLTLPRKISKENVIEITLDNEETIRCTKDHKFILRNGESIQARYIEEGTSLLPLYLNRSHGYETLWNPIKRTWRCTHLLVGDMMRRLNIWGEHTANLHTHHKDNNKNNNNPSNLEMLTSREHAIMHNKDKDLSAQAKKYWENEDAKKLHIEKLHAPEAREKALASRKIFCATEQGKEILRTRSIKTWQNATEERREKQRLIARKMNIREDITEERVREALIKEGTIRGAARALNVDRSAFRRCSNVLKEFKNKELPNNHKVVSVKEVKGIHNVFCLTAPETGNFALASGVIVHNCGIIINTTPIENSWKGFLTIEIGNSNPCPARIYALEGICQLEFEMLAGVPDSDYSGKKYQDQRDVTPARVL